MWKDWKVVRWLDNAMFEPVKENKPVVEASPAANRKKSLIKRLGVAFGGSSSGRENFKGPEEFQFEQIEMAYMTDSYIRQAVDKYVDYMFKAGWDFAGKNPKTVEYIKQRLAAAAQATQTPTDQMFFDIAEELIKYHNVFIIKARAPSGYAFPPGLRVSPLDGQKPIAGYYVLPTATVQIDRDVNGTVRKYKQEIAGAEKPVIVKATDMVHIYVDKQPGRAFGVPFLWNVLDDIKLLRQLEELVDRMIFKNIFPLMIYQVGLEKDGFQATDEEIEEVKEMLGELTMDGGIVLPERHNIKAVGAEGKALDVNGYLTYFEKRVFTGLGVSEMMMGRGDTANRSTSDNMDAAFKDRIKAYQRIMATFINEFMITELLLEGGYDPILKEQDKVEFRFREIDFDSKIKEENHTIQQFTQNVITHEEMRMALGKDPVTDEERLYFNMITAALEAKKAEQKVQAGNNTGANKAKPTNQHAASRESVVESVQQRDELVQSLNLRWEASKADVIESVRRFYRNNPDGKYNTDALNALTNLTITSMMPVIQKYIKQAFLEGVDAAKVESNSRTRININYDYNTNLLTDKITKTLQILMTQDLMRQIERALDKSDSTEILSSVIGAFDALKYRLKFLATTETCKAYNAGFSRAARALGYSEVGLEVEEGCEECQRHKGATVNLLSGDMPPFHPNCTCKLTLKKEGS